MSDKMSVGELSGRNNLTAYLHPVQVEEQEVVISSRFLNEDGTPATFLIRPITQAENDGLIRLSTRRRKENGKTVETMDSVEYGRRVVVAATVWPKFDQEEMCKAYGTMDPLEVPGKMLLTGEYGKLSKAIMELSGLDDDLGEAAKN